MQLGYKSASREFRRFTCFGNEIQVGGTEDSGTQKIQVIGESGFE